MTCRRSLFIACLGLAVVVNLGGCRWLAGYDAAEAEAGVAGDIARHDRGSADGARDGADGADGARDGPPADGPLVPTDGSSDVISPPTTNTCFGGWCWVYPAVPTNTLEAVWGTGPTNLFAVGRAGTILHRSSAGWTTVSVGGTADHLDIWGDAAGNTWVVGSDTSGNVGAIRQRAATASAWKPEPLAPNISGAIRGVWSAGPGSEVWAVTDTQVIKRKSSGSWIVQDTPGAALRDIWGVGPADIYAFGEDGSIFRGHSTTSFVPQPPSAPVVEVAAGYVDPLSHHYLAAASGLVADVFGSWSLDGTGKPWLAVHGSSASNIWAGGANGLSRFDGAAWVPFPAAASGRPVRGIFAPGSDEAFACGAGGYVEHRDSTASRFSLNSVLQQFIDVHALAAGGALLLGSSGVVRHIDAAHTTRTLAQVPGAPRALWGTGPKNLWVGSSTGVHRWDGKAWTTEHGAAVNALWGSSSGELWVVGPAKEIYRRSASGNYDVMGAIGGIGYTAIGGWQRDAVIGNDGGIVAKITGAGNVSQLPKLPQTQSLQALWMAGPDDVYALVENAASTVLYRWRTSETKWTPQAVAQPAAGWGTALGDVWVVTRSGMIQRFDGVSWKPEPRLTDNPLLAIDGSGTRVYAAGMHSTVLFKQ